MTFRTRTFLAAFAAAAVALTVSTFLIERSMRRDLYADIERGLLTQARLAGALLSYRERIANPDAEADSIGRIIGERLTFIAADGTVVGDSAVAATDLAAVENHASREEVVAASRSGDGHAVRRSQTTDADTMYAAVAVRAGPVAFVRVALPLNAVRDRVASLRRQALVGLGVGVIVSLIPTWLASVFLNRRIRGVAETATRYREGDFSRPARDYGSDEIGIVANALDHSARELGARLADMTRERAHLEAILGGMAEGILLVNAEGKLVRTNPAVRSMLRLPASTEGRHYLEVLRQPDLAAQFSKALAGDTPAPVDVELDVDKRRAFVAHAVPVAHEPGGGAVLVLHDVTALRRADQVRRDFVANVSHELRTPLTAIRGYLEVLLDTPPPSAADSRQFLDVISRHAARMEWLVRDLLRLARLDAGQEQLDRSPCDIAAVVSNVATDLETQLAARGQRVTPLIAQDAAMVSADRAKLTDVLRNLVQNASLYGPPNSVIEVVTRRSDETIEISVADHGPGIPESDLTRVFERFYRVDRGRGDSTGGTGLGLSIVRHLVELHGGRVRAANRPAGGAVVTVALPAEPG